MLVLLSYDHLTAVHGRLCADYFCYSVSREFQ